SVTAATGPTLNGDGSYTETWTVTIDSSTADTFYLYAKDTVTFSNTSNTYHVDATRETGDSISADGGPGVKNYVDANIRVTPNGVNEVGTAHTFTITVNAFPSGTGTPSFGTPTISWGTS